jgi:hypothetical protein
MKAADTMGTRERIRHEETIKKGLGSTWRSMVETGQSIEVDGLQLMFERDYQYFELGQIEEMRQWLDAACGQWIDRYMKFVTGETRSRLEAETTTMRPVNGEPAEDEGVVGTKALGSDDELNAVVEEALVDERTFMEKLLVYEVGSMGRAGLEPGEGLYGQKQRAGIRERAIDEGMARKLLEEAQHQYSCNGCSNGTCKGEDQWCPVQQHGHKTQAPARWDFESLAVRH